MITKTFFTHPKSSSHVYYEAFRSHYVDDVPLDQVALERGLSASYLNKVK